ncbi:MAG: helix-turn-helix domain-containing protein [Dechloromonas sp.]|nr:MAG: helix-turn-helix domain-containing protein [Dechloromonas sp.]
MRSSALGKQGRSKSEIASSLGVSRPTISSWLKRSGASSLREAVDIHLSRFPSREALTPAKLHKATIRTVRDAKPKA